MFTNKKLIYLLLAFIPVTSYAACDNLISHLNKVHPDRILSQAYGYSHDRLVIFEQAMKNTSTVLSVVECVNNSYQTVESFELKDNSIINLEFDDVAGAMIVVFSVDPPKTGYIEKVNGKYVFNYGLYER